MGRLEDVFFGNLLGSQTAFVLHVKKVRVASHILLNVGLDNVTPTQRQFFKHLRQDTGSKLGPHVIANERHACLFEFGRPLRIRSQKHGNAIDQGHLVSETRLGPKFRSLLRPNRKLIDNHGHSVVFEKTIDLGRPIKVNVRRTRNVFANHEFLIIRDIDIRQRLATRMHMGRNAIQNGPKMNLSGRNGTHIGMDKLLATIRFALNGLCNRKAHLAGINVKSKDLLEIIGCVVSN